MQPKPRNMAFFSCSGYQCLHKIGEYITKNGYNEEEFPIATARLLDGLTVVRCLQATELLYKQLFEGADYTQYSIYVKKGDAVFDVGGNISACLHCTAFCPLRPYQKYL